MSIMAQQQEFFGGFKPEQVSREVEQKLRKLLNEISKLDLHKVVIETPVKSGAPKPRKIKSDQYDELFNTSLEGLERNVEKLKEKVNAFSSPNRHFTKEYRTLVGFCGKYQTDLDKVDVQGNEETRKRRKACLKVLEFLVDHLGTTVHEDGRICPNCEIRE